MSDLGILAILIALSCTLAAGLFVLLGKWRPNWSRRKRILLAALPVPSIPALPMLLIFSNAWIAQIFYEAGCGVDACAMAIMFSSIALFWIAVVYGLASVSAAITLCITERAGPSTSRNGIFE